MNYASVVFAGFASISIGWYFIRGRKHFRGPPVPTDMDSMVKGQSIDVEKDLSSGEAPGKEAEKGVGVEQ